LEHLSDASVLVKLLVFPANVRLEWKVIARYKHSSLFGLIDSDEEQKVDAVDTRPVGIFRELEEVISGVFGDFCTEYEILARDQCYKTFYGRKLGLFIIS
jgi:hypothetical protein